MLKTHHQICQSGHVLELNEQGLTSPFQNAVIERNTWLSNLNSQIRNNSLEECQELLSKSYQLTEIEFKNVLIEICRLGHDQIFQLMLSWANRRLQDVFIKYQDLLSLAMNGGHAQIINLFLAIPDFMQLVKPEILNGYVHTPNYSEKLSILLSDNNDAQCAFFIAYYQENLSMLSILLKNKAIDVNRNISNFYGGSGGGELINSDKFKQLLIRGITKKETALHIACKKHNVKMVKMLLEVENLDVNRLNSDSEMPFDLACANANIEIMKLLLSDKRTKINEKRALNLFILRPYAKTVFYPYADEDIDLFLFILRKYQVFLTKETWKFLAEVYTNKDPQKIIIALFSHKQREGSISLHKKYAQRYFDLKPYKTAAKLLDNADFLQAFLGINSVRELNNLACNYQEKFNKKLMLNSLSKAIKNKNHEEVEFLLNHNADLNYQQSKEDSALTLAINSKDKEIKLIFYKELVHRADAHDKNVNNYFYQTARKDLQNFKATNFVGFFSDKVQEKPLPCETEELKERFYEPVANFSFFSENPKETRVAKNAMTANFTDDAKEDLLCSL